GLLPHYYVRLLCGLERGAPALPWLGGGRRGCRAVVGASLVPGERDDSRAAPTLADDLAFERGFLGRGHAERVSDQHPVPIRRGVVLNGPVRKRLRVCDPALDEPLCIDGAIGDEVQELRPPHLPLA